MAISSQDEFLDQVKRLFGRWQPLRTDGAKVLLWDYNEGKNTAVIYRFVMAKKDVSDLFTIYVGSGENLSGRTGKTSLVHQYRSGNRKQTIRPRIEGQIQTFGKVGYEAWTEIAELGQGLKSRREIIENLAIVKYWLEYVRKLQRDPSIPKLLNEKIDRLGQLGELLISLGFVQ